MVVKLTAWPSGLRRQLKALVRKGVGSNPTAVTRFFHTSALIQKLGDFFINHLIERRFFPKAFILTFGIAEWRSG